MSGVKEKRARLICLAKAWKGPAGTIERPAHRRRIGIEEFLSWAYQRELPKTRWIARGPAAPRSAWRTIERWAEELSLARMNDNTFGVTPDLCSQGLPHPDAIQAHEAVCRLDDLDVGLPEDWAPIFDLGDLDGHAAALPARALDALFARDRSGAMQLRASARQLVFHHAIMGGCPDWRIEPPIARILTEYGRPKYFRRHIVWFDGADGPIAHEVEIDGFCRKTRRPLPDAYTKTELDPDPLPGVVARGEYEIWRSALDWLAEDLRERCEVFEILPSDRPWRPWETGDVKRGRVLRDVSGKRAFTWAPRNAIEQGR
jgi:hypothetical protein